MGLRAGCLGVGCWLCLACGESVSRPAPGLGPEGAGGSAGGTNGAGAGGALAIAGAAGVSAMAGSGGTNGQGGSGSPSGLAGAPGLGGTDAEGACPCDAGSSAEAGAAGASGAAGAGGAAAAGGGADAGGAAGAGTGGTPADGDSCGSLGPDGQQLVTLQPDGIEVFALPIGSSRVAASGFDPCARVCASIIWDYSNNELPYVRNCEDFLEYPGFPYVVLLTEQEAPCPGLWEYEGVEPSAASGCIDPNASLVDALVGVEVGGERYVIRANNVP